MGCAQSTASTPAQPPAANTPNDSNKPKPDQKMNTSASQANILNKIKKKQINSRLQVQTLINRNLHPRMRAICGVQLNH